MHFDRKEKNFLSKDKYFGSDGALLAFPYELSIRETSFELTIKVEKVGKEKRIKGQIGYIVNIYDVIKNDS